MPTDTLTEALPEAVALVDDTEAKPIPAADAGKADPASELPPVIRLDPDGEPGPRYMTADGQFFEMPSNASIDRKIARSMADERNRRPIPPDKYQLMIERVKELAPGKVEIYAQVSGLWRYLKLSFDLNDKKDAARFAQLKHAADLPADAPAADLQWQFVFGRVKCVAGKTRNVVTEYSPIPASEMFDPETWARLVPIIEKMQEGPGRYTPTPEEWELMKSAAETVESRMAYRVVPIE